MSTVYSPQGNSVAKDYNVAHYAWATAQDPAQCTYKNEISPIVLDEIDEPEGLGRVTDQVFSLPSEKSFM